MFEYNSYFMCKRYGDGKTCLPNGIPQRVNGIVNGRINSADIVEQSLHCYIVTQDGRTYTAISRFVYLCTHAHIHTHIKILLNVLC